MSKRMISLMSSDGESFTVDEAVCVQSPMITYMVEDVSADDVILLSNVKGKILAKVIEYCMKHIDVDGDSSSSSSSSSDLKKWDAEFLEVDQSTIFELILTANYLKIKSLLDLTCQTVANMIKGKTPDEIRKHFNVEKDFTPEEEAEIRRENQWLFE